MIIVSSLNYDVVAIRWINKNHMATIESEKIKVIEEKGNPISEFINELGNLNMIYNEAYSILIADSRNK